MGISVTNLLIIGGIVILLFGTKKLRTLGSDLGESIKGFKKALNEEEDTSKEKDADFSTKKNIEQEKEAEKEKSN